MTPVRALLLSQSPRVCVCSDTGVARGLSGPPRLCPFHLDPSGAPGSPLRFTCRSRAVRQRARRRLHSAPWLRPCRPPRPAPQHQAPRYLALPGAKGIRAWSPLGPCPQPHRRPAPHVSRIPALDIPAPPGPCSSPRAHTAEPDAKPFVRGAAIRVPGGWVERAAPCPAMPGRPPGKSRPGALRLLLVGPRNAART